MNLTITPLDAPLGAEVAGYDFAASPDSESVSELRDAVDEHLLLLFRNPEPPTPAQVTDFCESFGPLRPTLADKSRLPGFPGINRVSNVDVDGVVGTGGTDVVTFHSDLSFNPPLIEFLYLDAVTLPSEGGATKWLNLVAAYQDLDDEFKARIDDIGVVYRLRDGLDFGGYFKATDGEALLADRTCISLVQTNPRNGRRSVWPNTGPDFAADVEDHGPDEGAALLADLFAHCTQDRYVYEHHWSVGESVLWLNTQTMHQREAFPSDQVRELRHVNILGHTDPRQVA
ncbi:TauD/TfdA dioxygenase family protein [Candidatus Poriferisocius sp.]|uniref:TauD/TfdA dioxygenase family protein n=1 Tax=Candidatus Poriferisocius sp. TaxID=3101276 RepID=UPI003B01C1CC